MNFEKVVEIQIKEIEKLKQALAVAEEVMRELDCDCDDQSACDKHIAFEKIKAIKDGKV